MSCYYHTSPWKCINNIGCDLTQFRYHVRIFPKSGLAADSNRVNKNVANAWRKLKPINGSRFLKLIYCYAIYSFPQMRKFLFIPRFIPKQTLQFAKRNPNRWPFFRFILGRSIACWFILFRHWYCVQCYLFALCILYMCVTIAYFGSKLINPVYCE